MQNNVVQRVLGLPEKTQSHPTVTVIGSCVISCRDRIYKREKLGVGSSGGLQLRQQLLPLALQHGLHARPGNIASPCSVKLVADLLVVSRNRLRNGAGGGTHTEKPACYLLPRADLSK